MVKKLCLALSLVLGSHYGTSLYAQTQVPLQVEQIDPTGSQGHYPRSPILAPTASLDDHTLYINGEHPDYVVRLLDEGDNVVYQTVMLAGENSITLPSTLTGDYQVQLIWGNWMFYGWITL